jgi:hypothetical protein
LQALEKPTSLPGNFGPRIAFIATDSEMKMAKRAVTQANEISYELHTLGWKAFQDLCATIAGEVWGQTIQTFAPSHDAGRDGAFCGQWEQESGEAFKGTFTVQCKLLS